MALVPKLPDPLVIHNPTPRQLEEADRKLHEALPPPGHVRNETLKQAREATEQKAEEIAADPSNLGTFDPEAFKRKFQEEYRHLSDVIHGRSDGGPLFPGLLSDYRYFECYAPEGFSRAGEEARAMFIRAKELGYEVVTKSMPEGRANLEWIDVNGQFRHGESLLMRIPLWRHNLIEIIHSERTKTREGKRHHAELTGEMEKIGGMNVGRVLDPDEAVQATGAHGRVINVPSNPITDRWVKEGTIPGMPVE